MRGSAEVSDREIADAVAGVEDEMLDLLSRLVEAPTTLGNEEAGQEIVEQAFRDLLGLEPFDLSLDAEALYDGLRCDGSVVADDAPIVQAVAGAWDAVAGSPAVTGPTTATTDARAFIASGIPAVCIGPHAERIHGVDERVFVPSVVQTAQVLALLVRDWCGLA